MKDHKDNFVNHPTLRLLNPVKNEIERIRKSILDKIHNCFCKKLKCGELKNTIDVINWSVKIDKKHLHTFTIFEIKEFYPSVKETLLKNTIEFSV